MFVAPVECAAMDAGEGPESGGDAKPSQGSLSGFASPLPITSADRRAAAERARAYARSGCADHPHLLRCAPSHDGEEGVCARRDQNRQSFGRLLQEWLGDLDPDTPIFDKPDPEKSSTFKRP